MADPRPQLPPGVDEVHAEVERVSRRTWRVRIIYRDSRPHDWPAGQPWNTIPRTWAEERRWGRERAERLAWRLLDDFARERSITAQRHTITPGDPRG